MLILNKFDAELYGQIKSYAYSIMRDNKLTEIIYGFRTTDKIVLAETLDELTIFENHKEPSTNMSFIDVCGEMNAPLQDHFCNIYYLVNKEIA